MIFNNKCWTYVTQFYLSVTFGKGSSILLCKKRTMFEYIREINYEIDLKKNQSFVVSSFQRRPNSYSASYPEPIYLQIQQMNPK